MGSQISAIVSNAGDRTREAASNAALYIAGPEVQYIVKRPLKTVLHIVNRVSILVPVVIVPALLSVLGWCSVGVCHQHYNILVKVVLVGDAVYMSCST